jgi:hypothetical protein
MNKAKETTGFWPQKKFIKLLGKVTNPTTSELTDLLRIVAGKEKWKKAFEAIIKLFSFSGLSPEVAKAIVDIAIDASCIKEEEKEKHFIEFLEEEFLEVASEKFPNFDLLSDVLQSVAEKKDWPTAVKDIVVALYWSTGIWTPKFLKYQKANPLYAKGEGAFSDSIKAAMNLAKGKTKEYLGTVLGCEYTCMKNFQVGEEDED